MDCWSEEAIEREARKMSRGDRPQDAEFLDHARSCVRCGELLLLFQNAERGMELELSALPSVPGAHVLRLRPARSGVAGRKLDALKPVEFDLAADTRRAEQKRVITLTTEGGSFLVRLFPNDPEPGATAVLVASQGDPTRITLPIGKDEFPFGADGIARIPDFPGPDVYLIVR